MAKKKPLPPPKKPNLTLVYIGLAVLVIAALAVYFSANPETPEEKLPSAGEYVKLNMPTTYEPGKVKITEFLKFDCGHCYQLHKDMPQLLKKYGENISITYVPIVWQGQSTKSIEAYILAEQMGKGEEMQDALFKAQFESRTNVMESRLAIQDAAASIGLGQEFNAKLEGDAARKDALANLGLMNKYGVQETPTVIMNGNLKVTPTAANLDAVIGSLLG